MTAMTVTDINLTQIYHVILIEQEPIARRRIKYDLTQAGYRVDIAKSLDKGTTLLETSTPALILLDWDLEGSDRFLHSLRQRPKLSNTFITCLGHRTNVTDRVHALNTGADEFLCKPIVGAELLAKIKAGLRIYQLQNDLALKNQTLEAELEEATQYMRSQLPLPIGTPVAIDFRFIPSQHLGGDCFDYFWLSDQTLAIYLLDISGHGMGATLMAIGILNDIRQQSHNINLRDPAEVLAQLNQRIQMSDHHSKYLTMWYGVYEVNRCQLSYASAGHPPALLVPHPHKSAIQLLKTPGFPIGLFPESSYQNAIASIPPDSTLYVFSDGAYEFLGTDGQIWGLTAFQNLIQQAQQHQLPLDALLQRLKSNCASSNFMDDLSLLRVHFNAIHP